MQYGSNHTVLEEDDSANRPPPRRTESDASRFKMHTGSGRFSDDNFPKNQLEVKKDKLNTVFGVRPWAHPVSQHKKPLLIEEDEEETISDNFCTFGNVLWVVLFGWWLALPLILAAGLLMITFFARQYAKICWYMSLYLLWPFGKYIVKRESDNDIPMTEGAHLIYSESSSDQSPSVLAHGLYLLIAGVTFLPILFIGTLLNWFFVVSIPMAKVLYNLIKLLCHNPTTILILPTYSSAQSYSVLLCTYRAFNVLYFEYEVKGVNIVFLNLIPVVIARVLTIILHLAIHFTFLPTLVQFFINILCSIPITFYIGTSIASIACQTNYTIGAILNATFGSVTELLLFTMALREGNLNELILFSLTGSLLCDMLLLPGLSMIAGGFKYKEQQFSPTAAAISSLLLFVAVIGAFTPTIFYHILGLFSQSCETCTIEQIGNYSKIICTDCFSAQDDISNDPLYYKAVKSLLYLACVLLPSAYLIGLVFTFKTHTHIFDDEEAEEGSAEWSIGFSVVVMLISVACFGLLAEDLVGLLEDVLEELNLTQAFLGVTVIALTPAATEIANAIKFALSNQISLSVSIGSASSIQVALIQMPSLVFLASIFSPDSGFHMIFPLMSVFSVILAVLTFNYISAEGNTNYFVGSTLVIMYILLIAAFYFIPNNQTIFPVGNSSGTPNHGGH